MKHRRLRIHRVRGAAVLLAAGLAAACGSKGGATGPNDTGSGNGTFKATISGGFSSSVQGTAVWGGATDPSGGGAAWALELTDDSGQNSIFVLHIGDSQPSAGTYAVADISTSDLSSGTGVNASLADGGSTFSGGSTGGSIKVTSSGNGVSGTFTIQITGFELDSTGASQQMDLTISGSFNAAKGFVASP